MKLKERPSGFRVGTLLIVGFSFLLLLGTVSVQAADLSQNMAECAKIEDGGERLKCYDQLAGRNSRGMEEVTESKEGESTENRERKGGGILLFAALGTGPRDPRREIRH